MWRDNDGMMEFIKTFDNILTSKILDTYSALIVSSAPFPPSRKVQFWKISAWVKLLIFICLGGYDNCGRVYLGGHK